MMIKKVIKNCAINLLSRREHTKFELQRKLVAKNFNIFEIANILQKLERQGLQSDRRFTENYIIMRSKKGFGPVRIKAELCERGINQELIKQLLQHEVLFSTWLELAEIARLKKFGKKIPDNLRDKAKQMKFLYYKGFNMDLIKKIL